MNARLLAVLLVASAAGFAGDGGFDYVVKAIESHYSVKRTHIPFMGVANFALKMKHPGGTSEFQMAVFQNLDSSPAYRDPADRDRLMRAVSGFGLHPVIVTHSRRDAQSTYIFMADVGKSTVMLLATFQRDGATVIQVKADGSTLLKALEDPEGTAESLGADVEQ
jgi:hypothetical protein